MEQSPSHMRLREIWPFSERIWERDRQRRASSRNYLHRKRPYAKAGRRVLSARLRASRYDEIGSVKVIVVPCPGRLPARISPPCASTRFLEIVRPRPDPCDPRPL